MSRREQIQQAAKQWLGGVTSGGDFNYDDYGFIAGAEWADANPPNIARAYDLHDAIIARDKKLAIAEQRLAVAVEALERYQNGWVESMMNDRGKIAREALAKIRGEK